MKLKFTGLQYGLFNLTNNSKKVKHFLIWPQVLISAWTSVSKPGFFKRVLTLQPRYITIVCKSVDPRWPRGLSRQLRSKRENEDATVRVSASPTFFLLQANIFYDNSTFRMDTNAIFLQSRLSKFSGLQSFVCAENLVLNIIDLLRVATCIVKTS